MDNGKPTIILDFDGTITRLFARSDLSILSSRIASMLVTYGLSFDIMRDPFDAFPFVYYSHIDNKAEVLTSLERLFTDAEIEAIDSGIIVNGFGDFIAFAQRNSISLGIVSNNSQVCIKEFFERFYANFHIPIIGRIPTRPDLMKPSSFLLKQICTNENWDEKNTIYIGDNPRDYICADAIGCRFIALTPTIGKRKKFKESELDFPIFDDFLQLIAYLKETTAYVL